MPRELGIFVKPDSNLYKKIEEMEKTQSVYHFKSIEQFHFEQPEADTFIIDISICPHSGNQLIELAEVYKDVSIYVLAENKRKIGKKVKGYTMIDCQKTLDGSDILKMAIKMNIPERIKFLKENKGQLGLVFYILEKKVNRNWNDINQRVLKDPEEMKRLANISEKFNMLKKYKYQINTNVFIANLAIKLGELI